MDSTNTTLSVLIATETSKDWQTFGTWYSFYKNMPEAKVCIACMRNGQLPFMLYQWMKRLRIPSFHYNPFSEDEKCNWIKAMTLAKKSGFLTENVVVVRPLVMNLEPFDVATFGSDKIINEDAWFLRNPNPNDMLNGYMLGDDTLPVSEEPFCVQANCTEDVKPLVSYSKGCGKWIDTLKGCPFSNAAGLVSDDMTVNEKRIIELWQRMVSLYSAVV